MSKLTLSNASNHLKLLLEFLDPLVDADEAKTMDRLIPILGDLPVDHVSSLVAFLVNAKFETLSSGLTYQGFSLSPIAFKLPVLVKSIEKWTAGGDSDRLNFLSEFIRAICSISFEQVAEAANYSSFHRTDALNRIRVNVDGDIVGFGEFLHWFGASDRFTHALIVMPSVLSLVTRSFPSKMVLPGSLEVLVAVSKEMERLSNQSSDKQEG